jgi:molecular chaperone DnaK
MSSLKSINFGIDLGTTNSGIAKFDNGKVTIYKNPLGLKETLASVVAFRKDRILLGDKARELLKTDPFNVFAGFKRRMGTDQKYYVVNLDDNVTPIDLSSHVLKELKQFVHSGEQVNAAVITIPASFDSMQSNATIKAGQLSGFKEVVLLQEPIAASLAYFNTQNIQEQEGYWLIYDLGGGTFDVALVQIKDGELKVADHEGNNFLGGTDFDQSIIDQILIPQLQKQFDLPDLANALKTRGGEYESLYYELLYRTEEAKKELSFQNETSINFLIKIKEEFNDVELQILRKDLEELLQPIVDQTIQQLKQIMQRNNLLAKDINEILLVGGSTYIPLVKQELRATGIPVNTKLDPTTAVAVGAAYYAANKFYRVEKQVLSEQSFEDVLSYIGVTTAQLIAPALQISLSYSKMSKDVEEVIIAKVIGDIEGHSYRITRQDGGFDTGIVPLKQKFTDFLPLITGLNNIFQFKIYDANQTELLGLNQEIAITQGQFSISGQPLPQDICIEIDDKENKTTKLEVIFEKNSILPQQKSLYRQLSKTILKDSDDFIIINILEGDRNARPLSNLIIGVIKITGKDLTSDLIKGSDIELKVMMTDSRELQVSVYLVMTQQEFKNVFSVSEKHINLARLKEQFIDLENEIRQSIRMFSVNDNDVWAIQAHQYLNEMERYRVDVQQLTEKDNTDKKYVISETIQRISQEYDKLGGEDRMQTLRSEYLDIKEQVEEHLATVDFRKDELKQEFSRICQNETSIMLSRNPARLEKAIAGMDNFVYKVMMNNISHLIAKFEEFKSYPPETYSNYKGAQIISAQAQKALEAEKFFEFRQLVYNITHLFANDYFKAVNDDFQGTGIG